MEVFLPDRTQQLRQVFLRKLQLLDDSGDNVQMRHRENAVCVKQPQAFGGERQNLADILSADLSDALQAGLQQLTKAFAAF